MALAKSAITTTAPSFALADIHLHSPILRPNKIIGAALNYRDHLADVQKAFPDFPTPQVPMLFTKPASSVTGAYDPIYAPPESVQLDYEAELAIVIGRRCRRVPKDRAMEVVAGAMGANDVTLRDWQNATPTMIMGKSWDTHCPLGPVLALPDEADPSNIDFTCCVNGELRQASNTSQLIFDIPTLINYLSTAFTLEVGDVILTGTTSGAAMSMPNQPWLVAGDVVRCDFGALGTLENKIEPDPIGSFIE